LETITAEPSLPETMPDRLRIAHCSDIHLDGDGHHRSVGADARAALRGVFDNALAVMRAHDPDVMLLAGDLFDANDATAETIEWVMDLLGRQPFPVVMIPGNHDCLTEDAIYRRYDFNRVPNVTMLAAPEGEVARLDTLDLAVWGKGMVEHSTEFRPLADCPDRPADCRWFLGLGHGIFVPHGGDTYRSSPIHMQEIEDSPCDYLALGHHHAALELVTDKATASYSGSPTDTVGRGETYVIVDLDAGGPPSVDVHTISK
jgi:DNA repair exonuclease SbcCD nuclease subunit